LGFDVFDRFVDVSKLSMKFSNLFALSTLVAP